MRAPQRNIATICGALAILIIPFLTIYLAQHRYHIGDIKTFLAWGRCLEQGGATLYSNCPPYNGNYPTVGTLTSSGVAWLYLQLTSPSTLHDFALTFRFFLAIFDLLNLVVFFLILRGLSMRYALTATLAFALLSSTRVGGALWGQIDTISQLFLSSAFLAGIASLKAINADFSKKLSASPHSAYRMHILMTAALCLAVLTKQLVAFTLPSLCVVWVVCFWLLLQSSHRVKMLFGNALVILCAVLLDQILTIPPGYWGSSLLYVLLQGSDHGDLICVHGFNIYSLFALDQWSSSHIQHSFELWDKLVITGAPYSIGNTLFLGASASCALLLVLLYIRWRRQGAAHKVTDAYRRLIVLSLFYAGFCNLSANVFLTGTHERYLFHYGFFMVPALLALYRYRIVPPIIVALAYLHLMQYGVYVLSILGMYPHRLEIIYSQSAMAITTLSLFMILTLTLVSAVIRVPYLRSMPDE